MEVRCLGADLGDAAVDEFGGVLGLAEFHLGDTGAQLVGGGAALVPDPVRRVVEADVLREPGDLVAGPFDGVTDVLDAVLDPVLDRVRNEVAQPHGVLSPFRGRGVPPMRTRYSAPMAGHPWG